MYFHFSMDFAGWLAGNKSNNQLGFQRERKTIAGKKTLHESREKQNFHNPLYHECTIDFCRCLFLQKPKATNFFPEKNMKINWILSDRWPTTQRSKKCLKNIFSAKRIHSERLTLKWHWELFQTKYHHPLWLIAQFLTSNHSSMQHNVKKADIMRQLAMIKTTLFSVIVSRKNVSVAVSHKTSLSLSVRSNWL